MFGNSCRCNHSFKLRNKWKQPIGKLTDSCTVSSHNPIYFCTCSISVLDVNVTNKCFKKKKSLPLRKWPSLFNIRNCMQPTQIWRLVFLMYVSMTNQLYRWFSPECQLQCQTLSGCMSFVFNGNTKDCSSLSSISSSASMSGFISGPSSCSNKFYLKISTEGSYYPNCLIVDQISANWLFK